MNIRLNGSGGSWKIADLGEIAEVVGGKPAPQSKDAFSSSGIPFVRMRDLGRYHLTSNLTHVDDRIDPAFAVRNRMKPVPSGSVLLQRSGSVALIHSRAILGVDAIIVSHICALVPDPDTMNNKFLYHYLCTVTLEKITEKKQRASTRSTSRTCANFLFPSRRSMLSLVLPIFWIKPTLSTKAPERDRCVD